MIVAVTYAPTLFVSKKLPHVREDFYQEINKLLAKEKKSKHSLIVLDDSNAKSGLSIMYTKVRGDTGKDT